MICENCACEMPIVNGCRAYIFDYLGKGTHVSDKECIAALKAKLAEKEPKTERFTKLRDVLTTPRNHAYTVAYLSPDLVPLLQAYDEAKNIITKHCARDASLDWLDKWG
jgi:hypothetical protein